MNTAQLEKIYKTRFDYILPLLEIFTKYFELVKKTIIQNNPDLYKNIVSILENIPVLIGKIYSEKADINGIITRYNYIATIDSGLSIILTVIQDKTITMQTIIGMSPTYNATITSNCTKMIKLYENYHKISITDDNTIFSKIFNDIDVITAYNIISSSATNKCTIRFIGHIIGKTKGAQRHHLESLIEERKNNTLNSTTRFSNNHYIGVQSTVVRYNLVPATSFQSASMITAMINSNIAVIQAENAIISSKKASKKPKASRKTAGYESNTLRDIHKIQSEDIVIELSRISQIGYGVVLLSHCSGTPVVYNIDGLVDPEYIQTAGIQTDSITGLNKKVLQRFNTITVLDTRGTPLPVRVYGDPLTALGWYVVETIDSISYRLLKRDNKILIPYLHIRGLIEGLSLRAHYYNDIMYSKIIETCHDSKSAGIIEEYKNLKESTISIEPIKTAIVDKLVEWFTKSTLRAPVTNPSQFESLAKSLDVVNDTLLAALSRNTKEGPMVSDEYTITHLLKYEAIVKEFTKELNKKIGRSGITSRTFAEYVEPALGKHIIRVYTDIIRACVDELDTKLMWSNYDISVKEHFIDKKM
jgi:hypothetical protein